MKTLRTGQTIAMLVVVVSAACGGNGNEVTISNKQFEEVEIGMTKQEVRRLLSEPERRGSWQVRETYKNCWFYSTSTKVKRVVCFEDNEVAITGSELPTG